MQLPVGPPRHGIGLHFQTTLKPRSAAARHSGSHHDESRSGSLASSRRRRRVTARKQLGQLSPDEPRLRPSLFPAVRKSDVSRSQRSRSSLKRLEFKLRWLCVSGAEDKKKPGRGRREKVKSVARRGGALARERGETTRG